MRRLWLLLALSTLACADEVIPPFGDLDNPVAVVVHQPSHRLLVASQDRDELRAFDLRDDEFLASPAVSFPLSIPTVRSPRLLAAGERFVFVVSGADGSVGFVDTRVPPTAFGPRSVDDADGRPVVVPSELLPTAALPLVTPHGYAEDGALGDFALVGGLSPDGTGARILAVRPPFEGALPEVAAELELPDVVLAGMALEPGFEGLGAVGDCRALAVADLGPVGGEGGILLGRVVVEPGGALSLVAPARRIEVEVEVTLPDGSLETRVAPVRAVEFAPVPPNLHLPAAVAADPCAQRSGRLYAILDRSYCSGAVNCPNFVAIDLPSGAIASDAVRGGPAAYELPAAPLGMLRIDPALPVRNAFVDFVAENDEGEPVLRTRQVDRVSGLVLVASSDGGVTYVAGGLGTRLLGPTTDRRTASDPAFLLDSGDSVPGVEGNVVRLDRRGSALPRLHFPVDARPRREEWTGSFEAPLPDLANLGGAAALVGDRLALPSSSGRNFLAPVAVLASDDPEEADRLVPLGPAAGPICDGFPVVAVEEGGRALRVRLDAPGFSNPPECLEGNVSLAVLPPRARPWTLVGSQTGFVGRASGDPAEKQAVRFGSRLLFEFQPPEEAVERGATFRWTTNPGFTFLRVVRSSLTLPASLALYRDGGPTDLRVIVAYSGSDAFAIFDPRRPPGSRDRLSIFR